MSTLDCILLELDHVKPINERMGEPDLPEELITMRVAHVSHHCGPITGYSDISGFRTKFGQFPSCRPYTWNCDPKTILPLPP